MVIGHFDQFFFAFSDPLFAFVPLALRTMTVSTAIVTDMDMVTVSIVALIHMTAQEMCTAGGKSIKRPGLPTIRCELLQLIVIATQQVSHFIQGAHYPLA